MDLEVDMDLYKDPWDPYTDRLQVEGPAALPEEVDSTLGALRKGRLEAVIHTLQDSGAEGIQAVDS